MQYFRYNNQFGQTKFSFFCGKEKENNDEKIGKKILLSLKCLPILVVLLKFQNKSIDENKKKEIFNLNKKMKKKENWKIKHIENNACGTIIMMITEKKTEFRNGNNQIDEVINAWKVIFLSFWLFQWEGREKAKKKLNIKLIDWHVIIKWFLFILKEIKFKWRKQSINRTRITVTKML